ncbi:MAG: hypothetical protein PHQ28_07315 [Mycobacterium sp.]|nr:hypothetical protein [Mycobacterium sp.]
MIASVTKILLKSWSEKISGSTVPSASPLTASASMSALLPQDIIGAADQLTIDGMNVSWLAVFAGMNASRVALPTYGFARERFWFAPARSSGVP